MTAIEQLKELQQRRFALEQYAEFYTAPSSSGRAAVERAIHSLSKEIEHASKQEGQKN